MKLPTKPLLLLTAGLVILSSVVVLALTIPTTPRDNGNVRISTLLLGVQDGWNETIETLKDQVRVIHGVTVGSGHLGNVGSGSSIR